MAKNDGPINMHKRIAMGQPDAETHLKKGGKVKKYATGGKVMAEKKSHTLINDSSQKQALPKPKPHAIATLKKGGTPKAKKAGLMIAIAMPIRKSGRGR